jgi:hypothetical protein
MVELKDDGVGLAAINARVVAEVGNEKDESLSEQSFLPPRSGIDVALFVGPIVLLLVIGPAGPAIGIPLPSRPPAPGEFLVRFLCLAA